ncbi:MAG: cell wall metabolism sensor histidine kinase WalK [Alicyclobacillus sp.]|nr:cell wall metabolism sensor histidine kinase WalK [Alicyclobacillus sp.]
MLLILFALELMGAYFVRTLSASLIRSETDAVLNQAQLMAAMAAPVLHNPHQAGPNPFAPLLSSFPELTSGAVYLLNAEGLVVDTSAGSALIGQKRVDSVVTQAMVGKRRTFAIRYDPLNRAHLLAVAVPVWNGRTMDGMLEYVVPIERTYQTVGQVTKIFETGSLVVLGLTAVLGIVLSRTITRPILDVIRQARTMAAGDYTRRVEVLGQDEFGVLAQAVNDLTERLQRAEAEQDRLDRARREFVANVSHELRTPLTSIKSYVEALQDAAPDEETQQRFLSVIAREADRMTRLARDLLLLSGLDEGRDPGRDADIDVGTWLREAVERMALPARGAGLELELNVEGSAVVRGNRDMLDRVMDNLMANAIAYTAPGGHVRVRATAGGGQVTIQVADTGIGIPEADLPHVFERFYRVDKGRSRRRGGSGLGLALAKEITELHGGRIAIESRLNQGTTVTVVLPVRREVRA